MKLEILSRGENDTFRIGEAVGKKLHGGEVLLLQSDLGGGKTKFVSGLVKGVGSDATVSSPTFTISQIYSGGKFDIHHYDLYRLGELGLMNEELHEVLNEEDVIVAIEWPALAQDSLPASRTMQITLERQKTNENHRLISINYPDELDYVINKEMLEAFVCQ